MKNTATETAIKNQINYYNTLRENYNKYFSSLPFFPEPYKFTKLTINSGLGKVLYLIHNNKNITRSQIKSQYPSFDYRNIFPLKFAQLITEIKIKNTVHYNITDLGTALLTEHHLI